MSYDATNITKFYERKLVQKLLATNRETANIFGRYIRRVTPIIQQYRYNPKGVVIRDPALEKAIKAEAQRLSTELQQYITQSKTESWMMAEEKTNRMIEEWVNQTAAMKAQSGEIVTKTGEVLQTGGVHQRNVQAMEAFMARKAKGMNLSDNVWKLADHTREQLEYYLESGLATGRSADVISRDIRNVLNEPDKRFRRVRDPKTGKLVPSNPMKNYHPGRGVYRSSYMNARRLTRTEITMAYRQSDMTAFRNLDMVLGYEVKLSAAHPEVDICDSMKGRYPKEFTWNLWHVQCLCYCVPVLMTPEQFDAWNAGDPVDAKYISDMPAEAKQYLVAHRDQFDRWKQQPYFIQQNEKLIQKVYAGSPVVQPKVVGRINDLEPLSGSSMGNYVMEGESVYKNIGLKESLIRTENIEKAAIFDTKGNIIAELSGGRKRLIIPEGEMPKLKDNIFSHNHPEGSSFPVGDMRRIGNSLSWSDIYTAITGNVREMRAVTPEYTFSIIRPDKGWPDISTVKLVHSKINDETLDELTSLVKKGVTTENKVNTVFFHLVNKKVFKYLNINYIKQKIKP